MNQNSYTLNRRTTRSLHASPSNWAGPFGYVAGVKPEIITQSAVAPILHPGWCGRGAAHPDGPAHPHAPIVSISFSSLDRRHQLERHHLPPSSSLVLAQFFKTRPSFYPLLRPPPPPAPASSPPTLRPHPPNPKYTSLLRHLRRWPRRRRLRGASGPHLRRRRHGQPRRPRRRRGLRAAVFFPGLLLPPVVVLFSSQTVLTGRSIGVCGVSSVSTCSVYRNCRYHRW
jgi:hypothetical protein